MFFDSPVYFVFLILVVAIYWQLDFRAQNWLLLVSSYFFYGWWNYHFLLLMGASTCINYYLSHCFEEMDDSAARKRLLVCALLVNFSFLGFFKYFNFFVEAFGDCLRLWGIESPPQRWLAILLPPGISFYTFQEVAYLVDVYRRQLRTASRLSDYALFVCVFPHLIAGPIQRPSHLLPQLQKPRVYRPEQFFDGLVLILEGVFRKIVIADNCALVANAAFSGQLGAPNLPVVLLGMFAFAWQIYGGFSGYSSIARGSAQLLGLHFMLNFKQPYLATSLQDFWRRWHISLSTWLRDYLYIPLGGNRYGELRTYRNLLYTMLLGGLWHGANWTFVLWGCIHGMGLALERFFATAPAQRGAPPRHAFDAWLRRIVLFIVVGVAWVFFRAVSVREAFHFLSGIGTWHWQPEYWAACKVLALFSIPLFLLDLRLQRYNEEYAFQSLDLRSRVAFGAAMFFLMLTFGANQPNAFIYFQF
jgi:alginate O-acetyltransferase complex protein AlgI